MEGLRKLAEEEAERLAIKNRGFPQLGNGENKDLKAPWQDVCVERVKDTMEEVN